MESKVVLFLFVAQISQVSRYHVLTSRNPEKPEPLGKVAPTTLVVMVVPAKLIGTSYPLPWGTKIGIGTWYLLATI